MINMDDKSLYSGLVRLHILHHAAEKQVYGVWISEELARHGYKLSAGTLYPILHGLENKGYLRSHLERDGKSGRRVYEIT
jgi:PadR family transcriptional regulator PadR